MKKIALATLCLTVCLLPKSMQAMQTRVPCEIEPLKLTASIPPATPINPETAIRIINDAPAHIRLATICERCYTASEVVAILGAAYTIGTNFSEPDNSEEINISRHIASRTCQSALCLVMASICHGGAKDYREIKHSWQSRLNVAPQAVTMAQEKPDALAALLAAEKVSPR